MTRVPAMPPQAPRDGNRFTRWLGRAILRAGGWTISGDWPDLPRLVVIAAPHSSGWDAVWGLAAKLAMGVDIAFIAKAELFRGPLGWLLRRFGGLPVNRSAPGGIVEQTADRIRRSERMWFVLAPEGTRRRVEHWKTGFDVDRGLVRFVEANCYFARFECTPTMDAARRDQLDAIACGR